jgi:deaminated glutathione amidase
MTVFRAACIQVNAGTDLHANIATAADLVRKARDRGADLILMPENVAMMEWGRDKVMGKAAPADNHPAIAAFKSLARETETWLHAGTLHIRLEDGRLANRTYLFDPTGRTVVQYDKIHMFDVDLGNGEVYRESATFRPGAEARVVDLPWGKLGLSICYDVRFPQLYRALAKAGADFICVPAAFTRTTGTAHWHVLLRARAIETGCYLLAPAQCGDHAGGRQTYGHALIVSPWGEILADGGEEPGFIIAAIDPAEVAAARRKVPSLQHDREFASPAG